MSDLSKAQKVLMIVMYCLTGIATLFGCFAIYNLMMVEKPWTIGVVYAAALNKEDGQVPVINVKVNSNENGNGLPVYDVQFNSYTDTEGNGIAGFGIQCIGNSYVINQSGIDRNSAVELLFDEKSNYRNEINNMKVTKINQSQVCGDFYLYYTGDNGVTYYQLNYEDVDNFLLISIGEENYKLTLKKYKYNEKVDKFWDFLPWVETEYKELESEFTWFEVFDHIIKSAKTNSGKMEYEEFPLPLFDLAPYVDIQYMDQKGQYHSMQETNENRTYLTIPVSYTMNGAVQSSDSLFKQVAGSPSWSYLEDIQVEDYWKAYSVLIIDESYLSYKENAYGRVMAYLDRDFSNYLSRLSKVEIMFDLDFSSDMIVHSIDLLNFDFDIKSINIKNEVISEDNFDFYNSEFCSVEPIYNGGV